MGETVIKLDFYSISEVSGLYGAHTWAYIQTSIGYFAVEHTKEKSYLQIDGFLLVTINEELCNMIKQVVYKELPVDIFFDYLKDNITEDYFYENNYSPTSVIYANLLTFIDRMLSRS